MIEASTTEKQSTGSTQKGGSRRGEALDTLAVTTWLTTQGIALEGSPTVTQYSGGASNWTYRLQFRNRDLVLRRPPSGTKAKSAHDMGREYRIQKSLNAHYPYAPKMVAYCGDESVIGCEFYVMERLDGLIPRKELGFELSQEQTKTLCTNVLDSLIDLHKVDAQAAGLGAFNRGPGYCRRQIEGWSERYDKARTWNSPSLAYVRSWLSERIPTDSKLCLIHNDFRLDNVVLNPTSPTQVIGILDWEMATIGDPLMDLGNSLAYWVEAKDDVFGRSTRRQPTHLPGMFSRKEVIAYYLSKTDVKVAHTDLSFYQVYGLFRLAVIVQQIYFRYHKRESRNPGHRMFWAYPHYLNYRCNKLIKESSR